MPGYTGDGYAGLGVDYHRVGNSGESEGRCGLSDRKIQNNTSTPIPIEETREHRRRKDVHEGRTAKDSRKVPARLGFLSEGVSHFEALVYLERLVQRMWKCEPCHERLS